MDERRQVEEPPQHVLDHPGGIVAATVEGETPIQEIKPEKTASPNGVS
jgi:hypothetical protein